jgi:hypothetical protein
MVAAVLVFPILSVLVIPVKDKQVEIKPFILVILVICVVGKVIFVSDTQLPNGLNVVIEALTDEGQVSSFNAKQPAKVLFIFVSEVILVGITTLFKLLQVWNVPVIIVVAFNDDGKVILCKLKQEANVVCKLTKAFILVGITTLVKLLQPLHILDIFVKLFCVLFGKVRVLKLTQLLNAVEQSPKVYVDGIVI